MSNIQAENLVKSFGNGEAAVLAVSGMSFHISTGEFIGIMGESGAGKSTLLGMLGAMNAPTSGRLMVDGIDIYGLTNEKRADFRREYLGFVFQGFHLIPYLTVLENVMLPLAVCSGSRKEKRGMAMEALSKMGLSDKGDRLPGEISGGEKERVAVARAIVNEPPVLLADEPTGSLDSRNSRDIMSIFQKLNSSGITIVMVTHSEECARYAERILYVADGKLVGDRPGARVCQN
ncbi:MAG: ABC transporter ATP-binding protein [Deltaproteobacteria bacterium HGW-Deltaproteobacteria-15]|jgi:putative ABC transport system ATP-binding protein|nr:MAG: ABC transporter ATP-binding protein [Deltaproteobacteria bacterium HGW-Deltaproteobacteria-15]